MEDRRCQIPQIRNYRRLWAARYGYCKSGMLLTAEPALYLLRAQILSS